jgi:CheY-like chemotaxis protein
MSQAVLERAPIRERMNDLWAPQQQEIRPSAVKSILVVEDDAAIRETIGDILRGETIHQIFLAQDGKSCLNMLQTITPDVFLLDYQLPDTNGLELLNHIRESKEYEHTPVVLMSASLSREHINRDHLRYLRKPFDLDELLQMVEAALTTQDQETASYKQDLAPVS